MPDRFDEGARAVWREMFPNAGGMDEPEVKAIARFARRCAEEARGETWRKAQRVVDGWIDRGRVDAAAAIGQELWVLADRDDERRREAPSSSSRQCHECGKGKSHPCERCKRKREAAGEKREGE